MGISRRITVGDTLTRNMFGERETDVVHALFQGEPARRVLNGEKISPEEARSYLSFGTWSIDPDTYNGIGLGGSQNLILLRGEKGVWGRRLTRDQFNVFAESLTLPSDLKEKLKISYGTSREVSE